MDIDEARARHPASAGRLDDWCALCVIHRLKKHTVFDGYEGLMRAVTTVSGTRVCGTHAEELLQRVLAQADVDAVWEERYGGEQYLEEAELEARS